MRVCPSVVRVNVLGAVRFARSKQHCLDGVAVLREKVRREAEAVAGRGRAERRAVARQHDDRGHAQPVRVVMAAVGGAGRGGRGIGRPVRRPSQAERPGPARPHARQAR